MASVSDDILDVFRAAMRAARPALRAPGAYDKVVNDECAFSFDTPYSPDGLYVSLKSYQGFGKRYVALDHERTGNQLYVHLKWTRTAKPQPSDDDNAAKKPTKPGGAKGGDIGGGEVHGLVYQHGFTNRIPQPWLHVS